MLHFTCMFDLNYKSYLVLSWNLNSLCKLFLSNINYIYARVVGKNIKQQIRGIFTTDKAS